MRLRTMYIVGILLLHPLLLLTAVQMETNLPGIGVGLFAQRGLDARAMALGGASVAAPEGPAVGYYNPAGLVALTKRAVAGLYSQPYGEEFGVTYQHVSILGPLRVQTDSITSSGVAVTWMNLRIEGIQLWDEQGPSGVAEGTGSVYLASFGFRVPYFDELRLGASLKYYAARLLDGRGNGFGADVGGIGTLSFDDVRLDLGLNLMDVGNTTVQWTSLSGETDNIIPSVAKIGVAVTMLENLLILCDVDWMFGRLAHEQELHLGLEVQPVQFLALRAGWNGSFERGGAFAVGARIKVGGLLTIDYAYMLPTVFGGSHLLSAAISF